MASDLRHAQYWFSDALLDSRTTNSIDSPSAMESKSSNDWGVVLNAEFKNSQTVPLDKRFAVYRNNMFYSLSQSLADSFPVVQRLVGEAFFTAAATAFVRAHPPTSAAPLDYGSEFPEFLRQFEPARELVYLADVARLELAWLKAYHAADATPMAAEALQSVAAEQLSYQRLSLHPSVFLLHSDYAIFSIWNANRADRPEESDAINFDSPQWALVCRPDSDVLITNIDAGGFQFLLSLAEGENLVQAATGALEIQPDWDFPSALAFCIDQGCFLDIH